MELERGRRNWSAAVPAAFPERGRLVRFVAAGTAALPSRTRPDNIPTEHAQIKSHGFRAGRPSRADASGSPMISSRAASQRSLRPVR